jgi:large subunit ribosomal protein L9
MQVILLEKIRNFGNIGDTITVKNGFARNYLLPQGKAVTANTRNVKKFGEMRAQLEEKANQQLAKAKERAGKLEKLEVVISVKATEEGKLFGSVNNREVTEAIRELGGEIDRKEIVLLHGPIHELGEHEIMLQLHTDVSVPLKIKIVAETAA